MKRSAGLIFLLAVLSAISGYLLSKASLVGRVGMSLVYREYNFLKTWWKGGLVVFAVLMLLLVVQGWVRKKFPGRQGETVHIIALAGAVIGLYFTYNDFRHTLSHRLLGERFHIGAYLFWLGWIIISCFYLYHRESSSLMAGTGRVREGEPGAGPEHRENL